MDFKDGSDLAVEYEYDKNGNLTKDLNKKITEIEYNLLNLPSHIIFADGNRIEYEYAADGSKVRTTHIIGNDTTITTYCGNAIYENGSLKMLLNEAGYYSFQDSKFHFYLKDHQGNIRVVADEAGVVDEVNDYYPFGGLMSVACNNTQPYKYNGKELDRKNGLDWYDYGARYYDAALGRWHAVDPLAEKYCSLSSYGYCNNNPICNRDEEGKFINNIIGAAIGGAVDLGVQVTANLVSGNGAFENIDWVSVRASTVEGALTSGLSASKTLVVKAGVAVTKNAINAIKEGEDISTHNTIKDVATDKVFGKVSGVIGKEIKDIVPELGTRVNKAGNQVILSNNKAVGLVKKMPGISDTKTARKIATSKNGVTDASKNVGQLIREAPENVVKVGLEATKVIYEKEFKKKE